LPVRGWLKNAQECHELTGIPTQPERKKKSRFGRQKSREHRALKNLYRVDLAEGKEKPGAWAVLALWADLFSQRLAPRGFWWEPPSARRAGGAS